MRIIQLNHRLVSSVLAAALFAGAPTVAVAQPSGAQTTYVEPSDEQLELNAEAVRAIQNSDYEKAVKLLEASNALGEMNVTWLNLGRAFQKLGECDEARTAYVSVISAPAVKDPSPRLINAKADQYLGELDEECDVGAEAKQKMAAATESQQDEQQDEQQADQKADQQDDAKPGEQVERVETSEPVEPAAASSDALGWTLTASGLVVAGAGVGAHFWAESIRDDVTTTIDAADGQVVTDMNRQEALDKESQANTLDTVGVSAIAVGAIVTGAGVYLLLTDDVEAQPSASVTSGGDVSIGLTGRF
jgi:tetratricopeptide (TPR) repeat protein